MSPMSTTSSNKDQLTQLSECLSRVAQQRDKAAFGQLFDHYAPLIRAYSLARDPGASLVADDLVQEVMTRLWLKGRPSTTASWPT